MKLVIRMLVLAACATLGIAVAMAMLALPEHRVNIAGQVHLLLETSGVSHPVTAVLLNFRGYDTLLEVAVLLVALLGVLTTIADERGHSLRLSLPPQPLLQSLTRLLAPLMVLVGIYLLWAGSHQPGGAFQAAAVLASANVLLYLSGQLATWDLPGKMLRAGLALGFFVFLAVALPHTAEYSLLEYSRTHAGSLIFLVEAGLTLSLSLVLAGLFLWQPNENEEPEE